jgi:hypothetical protein
MWSPRIGDPRSRFVSFSIHFLVADPRDDTSAEEAIGTDCASASGQSDRSVHTSESTSSRCHGTSPVSRRCIGAALSAAHPLQNEHATQASTFNMGRRIMAERRRHRRERRRQHRPHVRTNANNQIDAQCDEHLRTFVRALARQAARELFEAQRARHSAEIH